MWYTLGKQLKHGNYNKCTPKVGYKEHNIIMYITNDQTNNAVFMC